MIRDALLNNSVPEMYGSTVLVRAQLSGGKRIWNSVWVLADPSACKQLLFGMSHKKRTCWSASVPKPQTSARAVHQRSSSFASEPLACLASGSRRGFVEQPPAREEKLLTLHLPVSTGGNTLAIMCLKTHLGAGS
jgi:hypothetical protein